MKNCAGHIDSEHFTIQKIFLKIFKIVSFLWLQMKLRGNFYSV